MVSTPSRDDVTTRYQGDPVGQGELTNTQADALISDAVDMVDNLFSDKMVFTSELKDEDKAVIYLACHKWALALNDTVQSESQGGGSVTYNVPPAVERSLRRTTYGLEFLEYLAGEPNIGFASTT